MLPNLRRASRGAPADERFARAYIPEPNSGCWLWYGSLFGSNGYGRLQVKSKSMAAHRYAWESHKGEIPPGMLVLHKCDNPGCVNPDHLFLGTHQDNSDDKVSKGRHSRGVKHSSAKVNPARGEAVGRAKLKYTQVQKIQASLLPQRKLAQMYGVTQATISQIKTGKTWR